MKVTVEFSGGMELLFGGVAEESIEIPSEFDGKPACVRNLIFWLRENKLKEKDDLFIQGNTIRPGILVLINDTDWELEDGPNYSLQESDVVTFISTLHGG
ncbi:Ubiquitin-related modifier 1 [Smittium mucronatum]|uniref:Ubiquitin-related modifier 1 n=1 Tax=Smittium mucronatum TaxID=133383 RepID=A0A1R0GSM2_9FUNG|nr:Ubiquitin-related modifier 1 [Smittium mucronatum]